MSLSERLQVVPPTLAAKTRITHPKGWEPGVRFDSSDAQFVTTDATVALEGENEWRQAIEDMGIEIPDGYRVRIAEMRFDPAAWTRDTVDQAKAVTKPVWRYRFVIEPHNEVTALDGIQILNALKRSPKPKAVKSSGNGAFIVNLNDTQIGKVAREGQGTDATLERLDRYFSLAVERARDTRKLTDELVLLLGGDLVEGCFIYGNQSFVGNLDRDRRQQLRLTTGIILDLLDRLAPEFNKVRVLSVPGNHGEHRIGGKRVNRTDNDDLVVTEAAAVAAERDSRLSHVAFNIAYDEPALTADVKGHILALTHGSIYGKSTGGSPALKAYNWYKNQAAGKTPYGDADLLSTYHYHHEAFVNWGAMSWVQSPAMDGGSPEFADYSGTDCAPGMNTWLMTPNNKFTAQEILR